MKYQLSSTLAYFKISSNVHFLQKYLFVLLKQPKFAQFNWEDKYHLHWGSKVISHTIHVDSCYKVKGPDFNVNHVFLVTLMLYFHPNFCKYFESNTILRNTFSGLPRCYLNLKITSSALIMAVNRNVSTLNECNNLFYRLSSSEFTK